MISPGNPFYTHSWPTDPNDIPLKLSAKAYATRMLLYSNLQIVLSENSNMKSRRAGYRSACLQYAEEIASSELLDWLGYTLCKVMAHSKKFDFSEFLKLEMIILETRLLHAADRGELNDLFNNWRVAFKNPTTELWKEEQFAVLKLSFAHKAIPPCNPIRRTDFYLVPFEYAPKLFADRSHFIKRGYVWVYNRNCINILVDVIAAALNVEYSTVKNEDEQLNSVMEELQDFTIATRSESRKRRLDANESPEDLDVERLPPCITRIEKNASSFKYLARQTLGIFYGAMMLDKNKVIEYMSRKYAPHYPQQWQREYKQQMVYIMSKGYQMTSCRKLLVYGAENGGCVYQYQYECAEHLRELTGNKDILFITSPVDYYNKAVKISNQVKEPPQKEIKIEEEKKVFEFKNQSFNQFINKRNL